MTRISRRTWLARVALGGAGAALGVARLREALAAGAVEKGIYRLQGAVLVNNIAAQRGMEVKPGDAITTGRDADLVFVVSRDAFLVRGDSRIELAGRAADLVVSGLRIVTGALLSVFAPGGQKRILSPTASMGIRGTGIYVEVEAIRTYVCTCYGEADLVPVDDPRQAETVRTTHHDHPRYIYRKGMPQMVEKAPVVNHTDAELILLENLVGREPPFVVPRY